jgi:hypothetical protein
MPALARLDPPPPVVNWRWFEEASEPGESGLSSSSVVGGRAAAEATHFFLSRFKSFKKDNERFFY